MVILGQALVEEEKAQQEGEAFCPGSLGLSTP
jgi:hypothetical protein